MPHPANPHRNISHLWHNLKIISDPHPCLLKAPLPLVTSCLVSASAPPDISGWCDHCVSPPRHLPSCSAWRLTGTRSPWVGRKCVSILVCLPRGCGHCGPYLDIRQCQDTCNSYTQQQGHRPQWPSYHSGTFNNITSSKLVLIKTTLVLLRKSNKKFGFSGLVWYFWTSFIHWCYKFQLCLQHLKIIFQMIFSCFTNNIFPSKSTFSFSHPINSKQFVWNWWGQVLDSKFC